MISENDPQGEVRLCAEIEDDWAQAWLIPYKESGAKETEANRVLEASEALDPPPERFF